MSIRHSDLKKYFIFPKDPSKLDTYEDANIVVVEKDNFIEFNIKIKDRKG